jgi:hypothetical protein
MKFNQREIAEIYGYKWEDIKSESKRDDLRDKLEKLNRTVNLEHFNNCFLDLKNQENFKRVIKKKLAWLGL